MANIIVPGAKLISPFATARSRWRWSQIELDTPLCIRLLSKQDTDGTATGDSVASGVLTATGDFAGTAAGDSVASGTLSALGDFAGSASGDSVASGTLSALGDFAGTAQGDAVASATATATGDFAGSAIGDAVASGSLDAFADIAGTAVGDSVASGILTATGDFAGSAVGEANADAVSDISANADTDGSAVGDSVASGALDAFADFAGTAVGESDCTGFIEDATPQTPVVVTPPAAVIGTGVGHKRRRQLYRPVVRRRKPIEEELDEVIAELRSRVVELPEAAPVQDDPYWQQILAAEAVAQRESTAREIRSQIAVLRRAIEDIDDEEVMLLAA